MLRPVAKRWTRRPRPEFLPGEFSPVAAPRLSLQEQATPLQEGLLAPQLSSLRTSCWALCITRTEIKESVIYGGLPEGSLGPKSSRIQSLPGYDSGFSRFTPLIFEKRPPRDVRRQISDVASDVRKISLTGIVDKTGRLFSSLQIPQRFKQKSSNLNYIRVARSEVFFSSVDDGPHTFRRTCVLV